MTWLADLARADWLTARRTRAYGGALATAMLVVAGWLLVLTTLHAAARPVALDFTAFWAAARLAADGHPSFAYDPALIRAVERQATEMPGGYLAFYYPPSFLLLILPLGWFGHGLALGGFLAGEMALAIAALRRILPQSWAWLPLLGFPGFFMNGLSGQNAPLSAACFAAAAVWLEQRPALAGACLGALTCKPQLAACVPVALLAARRWRALAGFTASASGLGLVSCLVLGAACWRGFLADATLARADIETLTVKWPKMQSLFGALRLAGSDAAAAYAAQAALSVVAVAALAWICARRPGALLEAAALATAALLFTPFLYDYDLALLAVPLACLTALALKTGWRAWEKAMLAALFVLPLAARPAGLALGITLGPPLISALMALVWCRAAQAGSRQAAQHGWVP